MLTFTNLLLDSHKDFAEKEILVIQQSGEKDISLTYQELINQSLHFSKELQRNGIKPGDVVIIILQHGLDLIFSYFGCILHGCIPSIMPFLTEKLIPEKYRGDLAALVSITKPASIITYENFQEEVIIALGKNSSVRSIILVEKVNKKSKYNLSEIGGLKRSPNDIVLLQHSSGTTGLQKGVALSHQAVYNQMMSYQKAIHLSSNDVIISWLPLYHDMGLIACLLIPILLRIKLILMSPFDWIRAPVRLFKAISDYRGTLCWLPNFAYNFCASKIRDSQLKDLSFSSLRAVINCSEPIKHESHQRFLKKFSPYDLKNSSLATCYAMAENVFAVTQGGIDSKIVIDEIDRDTYQSKGIAIPFMNNQPSIKMVSSGNPIDNTQIKIISDNGHELPDRHMGEIIIKSNCMLTEFYKRPDETQKAFINDWLKTGDLGYQVDGELFVSGRKKDLIIVGGKNVYPQDLESLAMEVPGVHPGRVVAFGIYNEEIGTEEVVIVAEVEKKVESIDSLEEMIKENVTRGSSIALRNVYLVNDKWLIKTSSGKISRLANKNKYLKEFKLINIQ